MKVFVEFVLRLIFVDFGLAQNPYMPTTTDHHRPRQLSHVRQDFSLNYFCPQQKINRVLNRLTASIL